MVPSFVNTFTLPVVSPALSRPSAASVPILPSSDSLISNMADINLPVLTFQQPFVLGPGFSPVPAKVVAQIVVGKFIPLADNLTQHDPEPQLLFDGRLVFTSATKKQRCRIVDIISWTEAFTIYSLVLTSYFPQRWRDLSAYKLLILRTYRQFNGRVWLTYNQPFREHAAAAKLTDCSAMNVQLLNFHSTGASVHSSPTASSSTTT